MVIGMCTCQWGVVVLALHHTHARFSIRHDSDDKDEWKAVLKGLQQDGVLTYSEASDTITLSAE